MSENVRVVKGEPTADELAALVAVISALQSSPRPAEKSISEWNAPHRTVRQSIHYGPNMWRRSVLPR